MTMPMERPVQNKSPESPREDLETQWFDSGIFTVRPSTPPPPSTRPSAPPIGDPFVDEWLK